jgi:Uma2 family endonuclease
MTMDAPPPSHETSDAASRSEADRSLRGGTNMPATVTTRRFNVEEYHRMAEAGVLHPAERVELIEGEIVQMAAIGSRHAECVDRLNRLLVRGIEDRGTVRVQNPVRLSDHSEPEPDIALVRPRPKGYADRHPGPGDTLLIIEVADATLALDRKVKVPLYAQAGIPECWIVDLEADVIDVHRTLQGREYAHVERHHRGDRIRPGAFPDLRLAVDEIMPPPSHPTAP